MPEIDRQYKQQQGPQQHIMEANSTIWTPTAHYGRQQHYIDAKPHEFSRNSAKKLSERRKIREDKCKKE
jgi:hypothetical protein